MKRRHKATFVTIVPSPYQRDLFAALGGADDVELDVCYMEAESPDSPWPEKPLRSFERIMPDLGAVRREPADTSIGNFPIPLDQMSSS